MNDEQPSPTPALALTHLQRDRIDFARRDLESARAEDLAQLPPAGLILLVERLRGRLGDVLDLMTEIVGGDDPRDDFVNRHP
jgi:hypothetical protein